MNLKLTKLDLFQGKQRWISSLWIYSKSGLLFSLYPSSQQVFIGLYQKAKNFLLLLLSFRVPVLGHAGHGIRFDHWQPDHSILSYGPELGTRECPPTDQQDRLDPAAPAPALYQRMATSGSRWGEAGEGVDHSGRETPWEQSLHEEVPHRLQQQWIRLEDGVGHQREQAKGESFSLHNLLIICYNTFEQCLRMSKITGLFV